MNAGEVWAVTPMARPAWIEQPQPVWDAVERALMQGWGGKVGDAMRLAGTDEFTFRVGQLAEEMGAPVGQMFPVVVMRSREGYGGKE